MSKISSNQFPLRTINASVFRKRFLLLFFVSVALFNFSYAQWLGTGDIYYTGGNVGIGTTSPAAKLHVNNIILAELTGATTDLPNLRLYNSSSATVSGEHRADIYIHNSTGQLTFRNVTGKGYNFLNASASNSLLLIDENGNVGINTSNTFGYKLAVNGSAIFTEARVKLYGNWPDYVFKKNYKLLPLKDLEQYISENSHLPNIPAASDIQKDGINLGEMNAKLLEKIEELTLYLIELKKENDQIKEQLKKIIK